jgi:hypothetical protein
MKEFMFIMLPICIIYRYNSYKPISSNNRDFLLQFINNDEVETTITDKLTFVLDKDLTYRQSIDITIDANEFSSTNKKLDIYMRSDINRN